MQMIVSKSDKKRYFHLNRIIKQYNVLNHTYSF